MSTFNLQIDQDSIGVVTIDLADSAANILSRDVMQELSALLDDVSVRGDLRALMFRSRKSGIFIAGADINEIDGLSDPLDAADMAAEGQEIFNKLENLPFPTVAVIDGACMGGGLEFALACDFRVVSDSPKTRLSLPEVQLGILPGFGGTQRLPKLVGLISALELILSGRQWDGKKALRGKLVDACYPQAFLDDYARTFTLQVLDPKGLKKIRSKRQRGGLMTWFLERTPPGRALVFRQTVLKLKETTRDQIDSYPALMRVIRVLKETHGSSLKDGLRKEADALGELAVTPQCGIMIGLYHAKTALEKDPGIDGFAVARPIEDTAVLGAGIMGGGIAWLFSSKGIPVRMKDISWEAIASGYQQAASYFGQLRRRRRMTAGEVDVCLNRISSGVSYAGFGRQDLVVEAVVEKMEIKKAVLAEVEKEIAPDALIATNTSALSVSEMGRALAHPERFAGLHFFNPVNRMPLVEVIAGEQTSDETIVSLVAFVKQMRKTPVVVKDVPGFLVNRILMPYMNEACYLLAEGAYIKKVDQVLFRYGMPMGPFRLADEVGLDVARKVATTLEEAYGERMKMNPLLDQMVEEDELLGKKSGKGFYLYLNARGKPLENDRLDKRVDALLRKSGSQRRQPSDEEVLDRTILMMVNEAARCMEESVVKEPAYLDMAMLMGTGYPPFHGGPLRYADTRGINRVVKRLRELATEVGPRFKPAKLLVDMAAVNQKFYSSEPFRMPGDAVTTPDLFSNVSSSEASASESGKPEPDQEQSETPVDPTE